MFLSLGFTFSFPMIQESIKKGILVTWTKSFACPDGVGMDAVKLLEESLAKHNVKTLYTLQPCLHSSTDSA